MATAASAHRVCDGSIGIEKSAVSLKEYNSFHVIGAGPIFELVLLCVSPSLPNVPTRPVSW